MKSVAASGAFLRLVGRWALIAGGTAFAVGLFAYMYAYGPGAQEAEPAPAEGMMALDDTETDRDAVRIGWTAWADAEAMTELVRQLLEEHFGLPVEPVMADVGIQYQAVARGDLDAMLMAWLPVTHRDYWERVGGDVVNLGPIYTGRLGWVVPDYVPEDVLGSIEDLQDPEVARRVGSQVQGIDPGSGLMQASEQVFRDYDLDHIELVPASGAAMTAVLDRAIRREEWIVVAGWQPHWKFARYDLRFLEDPRGSLGGRERVNAVVRRGFEDDFPVEVTSFLSRLELPEEDLAEVLLRAQDVPVEQAVREYREANPARVRYWLTGRFDEG
ncbi:MAG: glycine betaine ABC transporter substrate-binding protein [Gemmatimonadota bacterium]|nr:glycine betaine ABC transporter substrate-binding protein [Gemmatimonadota bacterium]